MGSPTAMQSVTAHANTWSALSPGTDASQVAATLISKEDFATSIHSLSTTLQSASDASERCQVRIVCHRYQHINVFGVRFIGGQGADECYACHTGELARRLYKEQGFDDEPGAYRGYFHHS